VHPPAGLPDVGAGHQLPDDLRAFYGACGGVDLFTGSLYPISLLPPRQLVPANPVIIGEQYEDDISASWYLVARSDQNEHVTIDLDPNRLGRCYDSFPEVHGIAGSCPVVATSFTDLFARLLAAEGGRWYWVEDGFEDLGDAYD
jgi:antitoxin YokJ